MIYRKCFLTLFLINCTISFFTKGYCADSLEVKHYLAYADSISNYNLDEALAYLDSLMALPSNKDRCTFRIEAILKKVEYSSGKEDWGLLYDNLKYFEREISVSSNKCNVDSYLDEIMFYWIDYYYQLGNFNKALDQCKKLIKYINDTRANTIDVYSSLKFINIYMGAIYSQAGNYELAKICYYKSGEIEKMLANKEQRTPDYSYMYGYLGGVFAANQEHHRASLNYLKYYALRDSAFRHGATKYKSTLISLCNNLSAFYRRQRKLDSARIFMNKAMSYYDVEPTFRMRSFRELGLLTFAENNPDLAINYLNRAFEIGKRNSANVKSADFIDIYVAKGDIFLEHNIDSAIHYYQLGLENQNPFWEKSAIINLPPWRTLSSPRELLGLLDKKGKALFTKYQHQSNQEELLEEVWRTTLLAIDLIDSIRISYTSDYDKKYLLSSSVPVFSRAMKIASLKGDAFKEQAFNIAEKSKAILLFEAFKRSQAEALANIDPNKVERLNQLRFKLQQLEKEIEPKNSELVSVEDKKLEYYSLRAEYIKLISDLEESNPSYYNLKYELNQLSVREVKDQLLRPNQALLEYFLGEDYLYIFLITKESENVIVKQIPWDKHLSEMVIQLRETLSHRDINFIKSSRILFEKLIEPVIDELNAEDIIIISDGILGYVPFDILLTRDVNLDGQINYRSLPYLIHQKNITQCFSASVLKQMQQRVGKGNQPYFYAPAYQESKFNTDSDWSSVLSPLPHNKEQIEGIDAVWDGVSVLGDHATKEHFLKYAIDAQILHFSGHAWVNDKDVSSSFLAFTNNSLTSSNREDFKLYLKDIYQYSFSPNLVVLSGCETARGEVWRGEGIISLARAFSYSGAKSLITTLWNIHDKYSSPIIIEFYRNLKKGYTKDQALRIAKLEYIKNSPDLERAHPYYWASFIAIGDMTPISRPKVIKYITYITTILLLSIAGFGYYYLRIQKRI